MLTDTGRYTIWENTLLDFGDIVSYIPTNGTFTKWLQSYIGIHIGWSSGKTKKTQPLQCIVSLARALMLWLNIRKKRNLVYRSESRDVAKEGGRRGCAPWGFRAPAAWRPARARTTTEATETLTEGTKYICAETDKKARQGSRSGPLWGSNHLGPPEKKKQGSCDYQGPQWQPVIISTPSEYQGPLIISTL